MEEDVEDVRVRLLDLVEEEHGVGGLADRLGQEAALLVAHVAGRRADEAARRCASPGTRSCRSGAGHAHGAAASWRASSVLPTPVGPTKRNVGHGLVGLAEAGPRALDGLDHRLDGLVLAEDLRSSVRLEVPQPLLLARGDAFSGIRAIFDTTFSIVARRRCPWISSAVGGRRLVRLHARPGPRLVDHVDGLVGEMAVVDVLGRELDGRLAGPRRCSAPRGSSS